MAHMCTMPIIPMMTNIITAIWSKETPGSASPRAARAAKHCGPGRGVSFGGEKAHPGPGAPRRVRFGKAALPRSA